jgi:hypothetical protein
VSFIQENKQSINERIIIILRFFTTKGRSTPEIDHERGEMFTEDFEGYTLGYVAGRSVRFVDQLQFYWYLTMNNKSIIHCIPFLQNLINKKSNI